MEFIIVTRHEATIRFVREELQDLYPEILDAPVLSSASAEDVKGKVAVGNLPLHLAAQTVEVWAVEFVGAPPRGAEFSIEEMRAAGARIRKYRVIPLD